MVTSAEITREAANITHQAELGRPSDMQQVHAELQKDLKSYSPTDYNNLINGIKQQNGADQAANSHLPSLELYDSKGGNTPDSVKAVYSDAPSTGANNPSDQAAHGSSDQPAQGAGADPTGGGGGASNNASDAPPPPPGGGSSSNGSDAPPSPPGGGSSSNNDSGSDKPPSVPDPPKHNYGPPPTPPHGGACSAH
jgi:hypothetical protein